MYCTSCGKKIDDSSQFCPYCGKPVRSVAKQQPVKSEKTNKLNKRLSVIIIAALLALTIGFGGALLWGHFKKGAFLTESDGEDSMLNRETIVITPDQSPPLADDENRADTPVNNDSEFELVEFRVVDEDMLNPEVGSTTFLCFSVRCVNGTPAAINLMLTESENAMGQMLDDGNGEDAIAGDGVYTGGCTVNGSNYGRATFYSCVDSIRSNSEIIHFYEAPSEDNQQHVNTIMSEIKTIENLYVDETEVISLDDYSTLSEVVEEVGAYIVEQYKAGLVSEYCIDEDCVYFCDAITGLPIVFSPNIDGMLTGSGETRVVTYFPYATTGEQLDPSTILSSVDQIKYSFDAYRRDEYTDSSVTPELIAQTFGSGRVLVWYGHGSYSASIHSYLATGIDYSWGYYIQHWDDFREKRLIRTGGDRVAVTFRYIDRYCGDMTNSLVYLNSCHSGQDIRLAQSFLDKGAECVFGYDERVLVIYADAVAESIFGSMTKINEETNNYYSLSEAVEIAKTTLGQSDAEYYARQYPSRSVENAAHPVIYGNKNYRLSDYYPSIQDIETGMKAATEREKNPVDISTLPDSLISFLELFNGGCFKATSGGSLEYDYRTAGSSNANIIYAIIGKPMCVSISMYPGNDPETLYQDPWGWYDLSNFPVDFVLAFDTQKVDWIARNIFNITETDIDALSLQGVSDHLFYKDASSGTEKYYVPYPATGASERRVVEPVSVRFDGQYYYIEYDAAWFSNIPMGADHSQWTQYDTYYAVLAPKEIDGQEYWTLYFHSEDGFEKFESSDSVQLTWTRMNHSYWANDIFPDMGYPDGSFVNCYYDLAVVPGETELSQRINAILRSEYETFTMEDYVGSLYSGGFDEGAENYTNAKEGMVAQNSDGILSLKYYHLWMMGGVSDGSCSGITVDLKTGERLLLSDLKTTDGSEITFQRMEDIAVNYFGGGVDPVSLELFREKSLDDLNFYIEDNQIILCIAKYELWEGANGAPEIPTGIFCQI